MAQILHLDFETQSAIDLKKTGAEVYAEGDTKVMACGFAFDDEKIQLTKIDERPDPALIDHVFNGGKVIAHNVYFELAIWNKAWRRQFDLPELKIEQCECTMVMAYSMGLPGTLEKAALAAGISAQKDMKGHRTMLQLSKPRSFDENKNPIYWRYEDAPEKWQAMYDYCVQDIEVERQLYKRLKKISAQERKIWELDYRINNRGVAVDQKSIRKAINVLEFEQSRLNKLIQGYTEGAVSSTSATGQITDWVRHQGVATEGIAKNDIADLLETSLPDKVREVLLLRQEAAKSSTAKLSSMIISITSDGRIKHIFQYYGANTGRWAGRRLQPQNMPRQKLSEQSIEDLFKDLNRYSAEEFSVSADLLYGRPLDIISEMLRGFIIPGKDHTFLASDFSNIEGRVLAWLAGEAWKIKAFEDFDKGVGPDLYKVSAQRIYGCTLEEVDSWKRLIGKVAELACGYQGGVVAFHNMAEVYLVKIPDETADNIKKAWRAAHPRTVKFWYDLEDAAIKAVKYKGETFYAGNKNAAIKYKVKGSFLMACLPSGRVLFYPYPKIEQVKTPWGEDKYALTYKSEDNKEFKKHVAYGGLLAENVTQAVARDILAEAMLRLEEKNYKIVMHVHDEIVCEVPKSSGKHSIGEMESIMKQLPIWATGLPIACEGWQGDRYKK